MNNDLPLVAKKYSTYYDDGVTKDSHLLTTVCRQQLGLILEWCSEQGIECFEDTHRHKIVQKDLAERTDDVGVTNIEELNEFSQGWDGFKVNNMNELVVKVDRIDDLENAVVMVQCNLDNIEEEAAEGRLLVRGVYP